MLASLVLCLASSVPCLTEPPQSSYNAVPLLPALGDDFIAGQLKVTRGQRAGFEKIIKMFEARLDAKPERYSRKEASDLRRSIEEWRDRVETLKREERALELWEQERAFGPSLETAPEMLERLGQIHDEARAGPPGAPMPREMKP